MANTVRVKVEGLKELGEKLQAMGVKMTNEIAKSATGVAAGPVVADAKRLVPVRTGLLKSQIIAKRIPVGEANSLGMTSVHVVTVRQGNKKRKSKKDKGSAPHAGLVERGTVNMAAQPFLRPALDSNVSKSIDLMASVIRKQVLSK